MSEIQQEQNVDPEFDVSTSVKVPLWGIFEFLEKLRASLGRPNLKEVSATLNVSFWGLTQEQKEKFLALHDEWWLDGKTSVTEVRTQEAEETDMEQAE